MQGYYFIYQLFVVTSLRLTLLTKLQSAMNNVFVRCDACVKGEEKHFWYLFLKYGEWQSDVNCKYIQLNCVDPDWSQIGTAACIVLPAITWNRPSKEWFEMSDRIMSLYNVCGQKKLLSRYQHINYSSAFQVLLMTSKCLTHFYCPLSLKLCQHKTTKALVQWLLTIHVLSN
jgi:hypothetical protein